jgi:Rieske Fe-S protein
MSADDDKYPAESGRRRFVKGVVGASALGATGVTGAASLTTVTSPTGGGGGPTQFFGIENTDGPAPRGMPQIPIEIDDDGTLRGVFPEYETKTVQGREVKVATTEVAGYTYGVEWFQYCGVQTYAGLQPEADQDNTFVSAESPPYEWQSDVESGEPLTVEMFDDYRDWGNEIGQSGLGKPAMGRWRSEGDVETIPIQVLRSTEIEEMAQGDSQYADWLQASTQDGFIAWMDKCTHFCCVPGFKSLPGSEKFGGENAVYCPCHQSIYDPFSIVRSQFIALPRPNDGGGE